MSKHTPGPWELHPPTTYGSHSLRLFAGTHYIATIGNSDDTEEQLRANATLIAAAPDLLEVCERVLLANNFGEMMDLFVLTRAAIAKAKGGAA